MKAQTVLGPVTDHNLGLTLMHEHVLFDFSVCLSAPLNAREQAMADRPVEPGTVGALRFNPCVVIENLRQRDIALAVEEVAEFTAVGGRTMVDPTNASTGRDPEGMAEIARRTGLNLVMGSGYYCQVALDEAFARRSVDDISNEIVRDLTEGIGGTDIRAGLIGEIGTSSPITAGEERSLRAAARAQARTGAPLMIHMDGWKREGQRVIDLIEEEGGDVHRTVICHMNPAWFDLEYQVGLLERGAYLEFDMFGNDHFYPPDRASPGEVPAIGAVAKLLDLGYLSQLLISQDVYLKMMLKRFGGYGYAHLFTNLPPYFEAAGVTPAQLDVIYGANPQKLLAYL
ncbi:MAG: phosphotriesterase-related protein [Verrucomicrobiales bacterium]|jgi:phosphotriesterase-related protein